MYVASLHVQLKAARQSVLNDLSDAVAMSRKAAEIAKSIKDDALAFLVDAEKLKLSIASETMSPRDSVGSSRNAEEQPVECCEAMNSASPAAMKAPNSDLEFEALREKVTQLERTVKAQKAELKELRTPLLNGAGEDAAPRSLFVAQGTAVTAKHTPHHKWTDLNSDHRRTDELPVKFHPKALAALDDFARDLGVSHSTIVNQALATKLPKVREFVGRKSSYKSMILEPVA
jgi:hypothetical protein